ncbi:MAG: hypothetical protein JJ863_22770 [Deltaproteobacteria bacterium]|nr:hypothetical protein [Deltaproteobacteria bacterium]
MARPCPRCGEDVPVVLRGTEAFCTACGRRRLPFAQEVLNLKGKSARVGGTAARVLGMITWTFGFFLAALLGFVLQFFFPEMLLGYAVGGTISFVTLLLGSLLFFGGRTLGKVGERAATEAQVRAIRGLARQRKGVLTASEVARHLDITSQRADALMTELAQRPEEDVGVDVDDHGNVLFLFDNPEARRWRVRVEASGLDPDEFAQGAAAIELPAKTAAPLEREG